MSTRTFGEKLRRERELRGVSLDEVSSTTRISIRYLLALENEEWKQLPGGVFNRGFVRTVARYLGLNEEELLAEYAMATAPGTAPGESGGRPGQQQVTRAPSAHTTSLPKISDRRVIHLAVWILLLILAVIGGWFAWKRWGGALSPRDSGSTSAPAVVPPAASQPVASSGGSGTVPAAPATEMLRLKIEMGRSTLITVTADGKTVLDERVEAGRSLKFEARERFEVSARDSSAVLVELNGRTMPPLGAPGEAGRVTLTREDLKRL